MSKENHYNNLLGYSKRQVLSELGEGYNFYPSDQWSYNLGKSFFLRRIFLVIFFEEDKVKKIEIKRTYRRSI